MATLHCPQRGGKFPNPGLVLLPACAGWEEQFSGRVLHQRAVIADVHLAAQPDLAAGAVSPPIGSASADGAGR